MINSKYDEKNFNISVMTFGLALAFLLSASHNAIAQSQKNEPAIDPDIAEMLSTNPPPLGFLTRLDYI